MKSIVLKRFPYTVDGYTITYPPIGSEDDFGEATESLVESGCVKLVTNEINSKGGDTSRQPRLNGSGKRKG